VKKTLSALGGGRKLGHRNKLYDKRKERGGEGEGRATLVGTIKRKKSVWGRGKLKHVSGSQEKVERKSS